MRDPFSWSLPPVRLFGINVRVHLLFPFVALALILRSAYRKDAVAGAWIDAAIVMGLLFVSVLLHEFGHCFGARWVGGDASEVLLWPLGGLAAVEVPHTARANFITTVAGPLVNVILCLLALTVLQVADSDTGPLQPNWNPFAYTGREFVKDAEGKVSSAPTVPMRSWDGRQANVKPYGAACLVGWFFWCNYFLALLNLLLVGFPLDGGRLLQCALWPHVGYRQATLSAVFAGFVVMFIVGLYGIVADETMALCLAAFIYVACKQQWIILETGGEDSLFGTYDFSQGYTSLERDQPAAAPPKPKLNWWQRWQQRRQARKQQREQERREADERRMDQLLEKISSQGMGSLTDEERRFMKQFSDRYKNRR
jgi:stage IV sporulation protein FB